MTLALPADVAREQYGDEAVNRAAAGVCWRRGTLRYRFSQIQREFRELFYTVAVRVVVWLTCRRFGKSRSGGGIATEYALRYPGMWVPYAASTGVQVRNFIEPHLTAIANEAPPDLAPELVGYKWRFPPMQWYDAAGNPVRTFDDGGIEVARYKGNAFEEKLRSSTIVTVGCEDDRKADRLRGPGTACAVVDEARDIPNLGYVLGEVLGPMLWEAYHVWGETVRPKILVPSTAPREPDHPFVGVIARAKERGAFCHATVYDCDHLTERAIAEAIEEAGGEHTEAWKREGLAQMVKDPELVVLPEFNPEVHVGVHERPEYFLPCVIGDTGFVDMDVIALGYYDFKADIYVIEAEVKMRRARSDDLDNAVAALERELWDDLPVKRRRVDAPPKVRADMSKEANQGDADEEVRRWSAVSRDGGDGKGRMRGLANTVRVICRQRRLKIHPRCKTIIAHAEFAQWDTTRKSFKRVLDDKKQPLHHYDGAAALCYFVRDVDDTTNPYPALPPGTTEESYYIPPHLRTDAKEKRLAALFGKRRR